jgi:putative restriction endonuclease
MKLYVGITSRSWIDGLLEQSEPEEVNFWRPGTRNGFAALRPGEFFLFKLHAPDSCIVGGARFRRFLSLSIDTAWAKFGPRNGVHSLEEMRQRVAEHRRESTVSTDDHIGCIVLGELFVWPTELWMQLPVVWPPNIVQGRSFEVESEEGERIWKAVVSRAPKLAG